MKQSLKLLLCSLTISLGLCALAATSPPFLANITRGKVRVVLMSVSQTTVFPNEQDDQDEPIRPHPWGDAKQGLPCFTVTFLIESLGDGPLGAFLVKDLAVSSASKPTQTFTNLHGAYQQSFNYGAFQDFHHFSKPKVSNRERAIIMRYTQFGTVPNRQPINVQIDTGFGDEIHKFKFDSIRLQ